MAAISSASLLDGIFKFPSEKRKILLFAISISHLSYFTTHVVSTHSTRRTFQRVISITWQIIAIYAAIKLNSATTTKSRFLRYFLPLSLHNQQLHAAGLTRVLHDRFDYASYPNRLSANDSNTFFVINDSHCF